MKNVLLTNRKNENGFWFLWFMIANTIWLKNIFSSFDAEKYFFTDDSKVNRAENAIICLFNSFDIKQKLIIRAGPSKYIDNKLLSKYFAC